MLLNIPQGRIVTFDDATPNSACRSKSATEQFQEILRFTVLYHCTLSRTLITYAP